jgi:uncharacterized protein
MKALLLVAAVAVLLWLLFGRRRLPSRPGGAAPKAPPPVAMIECAHCGVHLPRDDARFDAGGLPYCSEAHRLAGPRSHG